MAADLTIEQPKRDCAWFWGNEVLGRFRCGKDDHDEKLTPARHCKTCSDYRGENIEMKLLENEI